MDAALMHTTDTALMHTMDATLMHTTNTALMLALNSGSEEAAETGGQLTFILTSYLTQELWLPVSDGERLRLTLACHLTGGHCGTVTGYLFCLTHCELDDA